MKSFSRFWIWVGMPALLAIAVQTGNNQFAQVGAMLMWVVALTIGFTSTVYCASILSTKQADPKWAEAKEAYLKIKTGVFAKTVGWVSLVLVVALSAYCGFILTAVFYFIGSLWSRLMVALVEKHFEPAVK